MNQNTLIGVDTSKSSFEMYIVRGGKVNSKSLNREDVATYFSNLPNAAIFMEACGGSHHWGRLLQKQGHNVKLIAPHKVRPFRTSNKNDRNDAKACVLAGTSPEMQFVAIKEIWQQDILTLHRIRTRHITNQTALCNELRGLLLEYGITIRQGVNQLRAAILELVQTKDERISPILRGAIADMHAELLTVTENIERIDKQLDAFYKENRVCQRMGKVEGVGPITATAIYASCPDPSLFKNGRQFAAWLGLTPGHRQTGGKDAKAVMLGITKRGDPYLRKLLVQGSVSVSKVAKAKAAPKTIVQKESAGATAENPLMPARKRKKLMSMPKKQSPSRMEWMARLIEEKGVQKAAVALANRNARVLWALLKYGEEYDHTRKGKTHECGGLIANPIEEQAAEFRGPTVLPAQVQVSPPTKFHRLEAANPGGLAGARRLHTTKHQGPYSGQQ